MKNNRILTQNAYRSKLRNRRLWQQMYDATPYIIGLLVICFAAFTIIIS